MRTQRPYPVGAPKIALARNRLLAVSMVIALGGCVELTRQSATRGSVPSNTAYVSVPSHQAYIGSGDAFHGVGPSDPFRLEMRSGDLIVRVGFDPARRGPALIGPILPLVPTRLRPAPIDSGVRLIMTFEVISAGGPARFDLSAVRVHLPDGRILFPICDPKLAPTRLACQIRSLPLTSTDRHSTFVTLPLPVGGHNHPLIVIDLPAVEVGGRRILLPPVTATHITRWLLHWAPA